MGKNIRVKFTNRARRHSAAKTSRHFLEQLEGRVLMSGTDLALADALPTAGAISSPLKRYRLSSFSVVPADSSIPAVDLSSQTYFQLRKQMTEAVPVITQDALASNWSLDKKSVDLSALATYAGVGGDTALTYTWSAVSGPTGATPVFSVNGTYAAHGTHVTFDHAGAYVFKVSVSDGRNSVTDSISLTVDTQASRVTVTPGTQQLTLGGSTQFIAVVSDQFDRATNLPITWSDAGVGTISNTGMYQSGGTVGTAIVRATSAGITAEADVAVNSGAPVVVTPAAAPASITGQSANLSVLGGDDGGEANLTYTWSVVSKPPSFPPNFTANGTNAAKNVTAYFFMSGNYTLLVTISDGTQSVTSTLNLTVSPTVTNIGISGPATVGTSQSANLTATAYDQFSSPLINQPLFNWSKQAGVGSISGSGVFSAGGSVGPTTISASVNGVSGSIAMNVISSNAAPTVATAASTGASTVTAYGTTVAVLGADDGGEGNLSYSWSAVTAPAGASAVFSSNGNNSAKNTWVNFNKAGNYTLRVTISDGSLTVTSDVSLVVAQTASSIIVTPGTVGIMANGTQAFSAATYDQFGYAMATPVTWSKVGVGSITSGGVYSAGGAGGICTITASSGGVSSTASITVGNGAPSVATPAAAGSGTVSGQSTTLTVLGADDAGEGGLTYSWSAISSPAGSNPTFSVNGSNAAKNATVTFDKFGNYTFRATISDGTASITSDVAVVVSQTLAWINVTPGSSGLVLNATQQFSASALDQFGAAMATAFTWSKASGVGSINSGGLYNSGGSAGSAVIKATVGGISGTSTISVGNSAPTIATAAATSATTVTGTTVSLSALGADDGGESNLTYAWSLSTMPAGAGPAFSANNSNAAKAVGVTFNKAGAYTFYVTISDGSLTITSSVSLTVVQSMTTAAVTPGSANVGLGASQVFTATGYDQFGTPLSVQPGFSWSIVSGVGLINPSGVYNATAGGNAVVRATSGSMSNTASVVVNNAAPTIVNPAATSGQTNNTVNLSVLGNDDGGAANLSYYWSLSASPAGSTASFSASGTNAAKNATASFNRAGNYTFLATITDGVNIVYSTVNMTVNQVIGGVTVTPGGVALAGGASQQFSAAVVDQFNQPMAAPVTWSVDAGGPGSINSTGLFTASNVTATATIRATAGGASGVGGAAVTAVNAAPTIVTAAAASGQTNTTVNLNVLGNDDGGAANLLYYWSISASPAGASATFSASGSNAAKNATATFNRAGNYTFLATISDGVNLVYSATTITVSPIATGVVVTPGGVSLAGGATRQFSAALTDQFGQSMTGPISWSVDAGGPGSINSTGLFTASNVTATATIRATSGSASGVAGAAVTAINQAPTIVNPAALSGQTGTTVNLSALGNDDGGAANLAYSWSLTAAPAGSTTSFSASGNNAAKNATATFNRAGNYTFMATISDGVNLVYSSVSMTVAQVATSVTVSPSGVAVAGNASYQFTAAVADQFGQAFSSAPVTWSVDAGGPGTVNSTGLFIASNVTATATIRATSGSVSGAGGAAVTAVAPPSGVQVTTRTMSNFTELYIVGTSGNDSIYVSQSGNTFTITANGVTQSVAGAFGDMMIKAGSGGSNITVDSSVHINTLVYGGAGSDTIANRATGAYDAIVTLGGGVDTVSGNGVSTNYWCDYVDIVNASSTEQAAAIVNQFTNFAQPWSSDPSNPDYISTNLNGPNLRDPVDQYSTVHYANRSLWGTGPIVSDVNQYGIGDCFLMADLLTVAQANPARLDAVAVDLGDGTYAVRFKQIWNYTYYRVDADFGGQQAVPGASGNVWAVVLEKAYAYFRLGQNSYGSLFGGWMTNVTWDFGWVQTGYAIPSSAAQLAQLIDTANAQHAGLSVGTGSSILGGAPIVGSHAYGLSGYSVVNGVYTFYLRNPWGFDGVFDGSDPSDGIVGLTYAQVAANFQEIQSAA